MEERVLGHLKPNRVFYYFEEISRIPRPSFKEKAISDYLVEFAKAHDFYYEQDEANNVIMIRPASKGYEDCDPVILQGHMDMVCEKNPDCDKDMDKEGLDLFVDGDVIGAKGTTLGGDDGIAIALSLALLEDETLLAPRLEFICTTSEECGMGGAQALSPSCCRGRKLINIDSEEELMITAGCAGGGRLDVLLPVQRDSENTGECFRLCVSGLTGGHSGTEIHKGRANANMVIVQILRHISQEMPLRFGEFFGGEKDNAIPRQSEAVFVIPNSGVETLQEIILNETDKIRNEFVTTDPQLTIRLERCEAQTVFLNETDSRKMIQLMLSLPNGVIRMLDMEKQMVETSLNLGVLKLKKDVFCLRYSLRSSDSAAYEALRENMRFMAEGYAAMVEVDGEYPAWYFRRESALREKIAGIYEEQNGTPQEVVCIHAGLECGILSAKIPDLDAVSIGPNIYDIHTPAERMSVSSVDRIYRLLRECLQRKDR